MRLESIMGNVYYDDLIFLKNNFDDLKKGTNWTDKTQEDVIILERLQSQGLCQYRFDKITPTLGAIQAPSKIYLPTIFSLEILRCGLDYDNYSCYSFGQ